MNNERNSQLVAPIYDPALDFHSIETVAEANIRLHHDQNQYLGRLAQSRLVNASATNKLVKLESKREKLEHKQALYHDLGQKALGLIGVSYLDLQERHSSDTAELHQNPNDYLRPHEFIFAPTIDGHRAAPRSFVERFTDQRVHKRFLKQSHKATRHAISIAYHGDNNGTRFGRPKNASPLTAQAREVALGATIAGYNKREKAVAKLLVSVNRYTGLNGDTASRHLDAYVGELSDVRNDNSARNHLRNPTLEPVKRRLTAEEARLAKVNIDALPLKLGNKMRRHTHREVMYRDVKNKILSKQILSAPVREFRRKRVIKATYQQSAKLVAAVNRQRDEDAARAAQEHDMEN